MKENKYKLYITEDTVRGILLEKNRHPGLECIVQMPGVRIGDSFYFDRVADSGINAAYQPAMCEKDHEYADHLATMIAQYYTFPVDQLTVCQAHCHPWGYDHFSPGDGPANSKLAEQFNGVICGIFLVDPKFRMKFWYIDPDGTQTPVDYIVDDDLVSLVMPKKDIEELKDQVEKNEKACMRRSQISELAEGFCKRVLKEGEC